MIDSNNSNLYFRILWMVSRNSTRSLKNATLTEIQKFGFKKTIEIWRRAKKEAKGDITKLEDINWCDNRQSQPGKIQKELVY